MIVTDQARIRNRIMLAIEIASKSGQAISTREIEQMLPPKKEPINVLTIIKNDSSVSESVSMENGFVVLKGCESLFSERLLREKVSKKYTGLARTFVSELMRRSTYVELAAVCGSVAYGSAKPSDDIDIFLLTKENHMWVTFFKALLLARAFYTKASINKERADFCLSYMHDWANFEKEVTQQKNALFAREFLSLYIIKGTMQYSALFR